MGQFHAARTHVKRDFIRDWPMSLNISFLTQTRQHNTASTVAGSVHHYTVTRWDFRHSQQTPDTGSGQDVGCCWSKFPQTGVVCVSRSEMMKAATNVARQAELSWAMSGCLTLFFNFAGSLSMWLFCQWLTYMSWFYPLPKLMKYLDNYLPHPTSSLSLIVVTFFKNILLDSALQKHLLFRN